MKAPSRVLDCNGKRAASRQKAVILPFYSVLVREHLKPCIQFLTPPVPAGPWNAAVGADRGPKRVKALAHRVLGEAGRTLTS